MYTLTPKQKAEELIRQIKPYAHSTTRDSDQFFGFDCEIHNKCTKQLAYILCDSHICFFGDNEQLSQYEFELEKNYWLEVKEFVNKLL